jgi:hypothetical protein
MFRPLMVAIIRLYKLKLVNCYNMQIQFDVEFSNTITFIGFTVFLHCDLIHNGDVTSKLQMHITLINMYKNFVQHLAVKVNSISGGNFGGSSMWFSTEEINY